MQLNDFLQWIKENSRTFIIVILGLVILSVIVGVLSGSAKRRAEIGETLSLEQQIMEKASEEAELELLAPRPVIPVESGILEYSFFFDQDYFNVGELKLVPMKISDLLKSRGIGKEDDISSFNLGGEELGVLTVLDELSEP